MKIKWLAPSDVCVCVCVLWMTELDSNIIASATLIDGNMVLADSSSASTKNIEQQTRRERRCRNASCHALLIYTYIDYILQRKYSQKDAFAHTLQSVRCSSESFECTLRFIVCTKYVSCVRCMCLQKSIRTFFMFMVEFFFRHKRNIRNKYIYIAECCVCVLCTAECCKSLS